MEIAIIHEIDNLLNIQRGYAVNCKDAYSRGMYNGLELARQIITKGECIFMEKDYTMDKEAEARSPERFI